MAREISIGKRAKISQAQQYMIIAVLGTALLLGVALALIKHFVEEISYHASVIAEEEKSVVAYSNAINKIGICTKPAGAIYTDNELKKCNPASITVSQVPGSLRAEIINNLAANESLNSVPKLSDQECVNPDTSKNYTYAELQDIYSKAETDDDLSAATELIQSCSALRVIPDALPAFRNEEALLSSLNKIFLDSGWEPDSLSPTGESTAAEFGTNLNTISVRLSVESSAGTTLKVLHNIEHSIREFNIERATIEWTSNGSISLNAQATAYFMDKTELKETNKTITEKGKK